MIISGKNKVVISDNLVGEVWICSGQSNMEYPVSKVPEVRGLMPFAKDIWSFNIKQNVALKQKEDALREWKTTYPNSAVAFSFDYFLNNLTDIPVGIIHASWGSSSIKG